MAELPPPGALPPPPRGEALPPLPPPPMAHRPRPTALPDVPLPWSTPLVTLAAGVAVATGAILAMWLAPPHRPVDWWQQEIILGWYALLAGLGATAADRLLPAWPPAARWGLGMAVAAVLPAPALFLDPAMLPGAQVLRFIASWCGLLALTFGVFGLVLGAVRESGPGFPWRMPVVGAALAPLLFLGLRAGDIMQNSPGGYLAVAVLAPIGILAAYGGLLGLAIAERLYRAERWCGVEREQR